MLLDMGNLVRVGCRCLDVIGLKTSMTVQTASFPLLRSVDEQLLSYLALIRGTNKVFNIRDVKLP